MKRLRIATGSFSKAAVFILLLGFLVAVSGCEPDCGNGVVDEGEDCDGSDMTWCLDIQECIDCQCVYVVEGPYCGNGVVDEGEDCDGSDMTRCLDTQECHNCQCVYVVGCGNGVVDTGEQCDAPDLTQCLDTQECIDCQCVYVVGCGNGIVEGDEECDGSDMTQCLDTQECHDCRCVYAVGASACGDGFCDTTAENTDLCPEDCECVDNGACELGEGLNCADCGDPVESCGVPCESSETCPEPLSCFDAVCWEACLCGGDCGDEVICWCVGYNRHCSDGTVVLRGCYP
jgi:hypothetical protein